VRQFLKKQAVERADMIVVAGGAKTLASPRNDFEQAFILEQVRMSIRLHQTQRVMVMSHSDCATYGGLAHFKGDQAAEAEHHRSELLRAGELLTANFPGIAVEPYFVKFDGIWEVKGDNAAEWFAEMDRIRNGQSFPKERNQPVTPRREL
jgi:hypothetical protein